MCYNDFKLNKLNTKGNIMFYAYNETTGIYFSIDVSSKTLENMFKSNLTWFEDINEFYEYVAKMLKLDVEEVEGWEIQVTDNYALIYQQSDIFEGNIKNVSEKYVFDVLFNFEV